MMMGDFIREQPHRLDPSGVFYSKKTEAVTLFRDGYCSSK
jgi:hypothetical protein